MKRLIIPVLLIIILYACTTNNDQHDLSSLSTISESFMDPPDVARPGAFWCWLNGNMTKESITRDLKEMSEKGMRRAEIWDVAAVHNPDNYIPAGPAFFSDESVDLIKHALSEGKKYGIRIGMVGSSGWNAGGEWVEPEWASKALYHSDLTVQGPHSGDIELPVPEVPEHAPRDMSGNPLFMKEVAVLAIPSTADRMIGSVENILDLSDNFENGVLNCELPDGEWVILRYVCSNSGQRLIVPSPNSSGLFIDFLDPNATRRHLKYFMDRLGFTPGDTTGNRLAYIEFDSMELDEGTVWTDSMPDIFRELRGYDIIKYLPVLAGWTIGDDTERFLYDWKLTISDQLIHSHYESGRRFLESYGIDLVAEAGGPGPPIWNTCPVDALKALGNVTIPRGEFWIRHRNMFLIKEVASASHIYGKKLVDAESFTTWRRWKDSPYDLKKVVDRAFCEGLNYVTFHTFASTNPEDGLPGRTYHAGVDINPGTTWWEKSPPFMDYLSRCSYVLQQGLFVADVCYFYGDQAPNFFPLFHDVPVKPVLPGLDKGYDFDVVNTDVILNRMSVKDGRITLPDGMSYSLMVLPDQVHMPLRVLKKLEKMVREGATVIGQKPVFTPGLHNNSANTEELKKLSDAMWNGLDGENIKVNDYGKGRVVYGLTASQVLEADQIPRDFTYTGKPDLDFIHRKFADGHAYFVRNSSDNHYSGECIFRQSGMFPQLWDPSNGEQLSIENFSEAYGRISVPVDLAPGGSLFVVFTENRSEEIKTRESLSVIEQEEISGPWSISFPEGWGTPTEVSFDKLISWTDSEIVGLKYFSGTACYSKILNISTDQLKAERRIFIDLGEVRDLAEVFINGQSAGILWKEPYKLDITDYLSGGENELDIEITNMWVNRLTGDMLSETGETYCRTNHPYVRQDNWAGGGDETYRIQKSGLMGPVKIIYAE
ncbi:MAG: glycosyl hydrolase [Bacteroidales bacterium]|nr:glycosyl hydrolase [Bacteroidales bacterium]